jgi:hypothetical protein
MFRRKDTAKELLEIGDVVCGPYSAADLDMVVAPLAIISSVRFSAPNRDSARDGVAVFGPCLDSDPASCIAVALLLRFISWPGLRLDRGELTIFSGLGRAFPCL